MSRPAVSTAKLALLAFAITATMGAALRLNLTRSTHVLSPEAYREVFWLHTGLAFLALASTWVAALVRANGVWSFGPQLGVLGAMGLAIGTGQAPLIVAGIGLWLGELAPGTPSAIRSPVVRTAVVALAVLTTVGPRMLAAASASAPQPESTVLLWLPVLLATYGGWWLSRCIEVARRIRRGDPQRLPDAAALGLLTLALPMSFVFTAPGYVVMLRDTTAPTAAAATSALATLIAVTRDVGICPQARHGLPQRLAFVVSVLLAGVAFGSLFGMGIEGLPSRYVDHLDHFDPPFLRFACASFGALGVGLPLCAAVIVGSAPDRSAPPSGPDPGVFA